VPIADIANSGRDTVDSIIVSVCCFQLLKKKLHYKEIYELLKMLPVTAVVNSDVSYTMK